MTSDAGSFSLMDLFREEVRAHAATLASGLLALDAGATTQAIEPLMRAAHSIKGAARIVNVEAAVRLAHALEDALVAAQEGRIPISAADVDVMLGAADLLSTLDRITDATCASWPGERLAELDALADTFLRLARGEPAPARPATPARPRPSTEPGPEVESAAEPEPEPEPLALEPVAFPARGEAGDDPLLGLFLDELHAHGPTLAAEVARPTSTAAEREAAQAAAAALRSAARIVSMDALAALAQALADGLAAEGAGTRDARLARHDAVRLLAEAAAEPAAGLAPWCESHRDDLAAVAERIATSATAPPAPKATTPAEPPAATEALPPPAPAATPAPAPAPAAEANGATAPPAEAVVRVTAESLNRLMSLAGESLVQARWLHPFSSALVRLKNQQSQLTGLLDDLAHSVATGAPTAEIAERLETVRDEANRCRQVLADRMSEFEDHAAQADDLNSRLYHEVIVSRMRPFSDGAHAFPRLVRDMARRLDKQVKLDIVGQTTEVDRDILDKLEAPLTHLLRNAVDHGIERPEDRVAAGKPPGGTVKVEVRHRAGTLVITVTDDGRGIDLERLRAKVVERRLTTAEVARSLGEAELLEFLFLPGFSTAPQVTEYSGRGVGLDVVHDMVRKVGGSVRIATQTGHWTRFHLQLPITLSVVRAVLVEISGEIYAFPHNRIDRLIRVPDTELHSLEHRQFVTVDGQNVGLVVAAQLLELPFRPDVDEEVGFILLSDGGGQYGLIVDAFRGEQDLVVRPLDPRLGKVPNISAAAILDDGSPVLIADVEDLIRSMDQYIQNGTLMRFEPEAAERTVKRVLVADDSITVREVERQLLKARGYEVAVAVDGQDAWNVLRSEPFDLLISDVDMPRMTGLELVHQVRQNPNLKDMPVIIVSYKDREQDRLRGLEVGANYYLTKSSFHDNTFLQAVADLIGEA
jgi:two-component system sensor histidine kinase and response regulator WspE